MKRYLLLLLGIMIAAITMANDVITKKNGTTIQCKVTEVGSTTVKYKRATNLEGPNYTIDLTEINSIKYENGSVDNFGEQSVIATNSGQRTMTDTELKKIFNQINNPHPGRKLRIVGYVLGGAGISIMISGWIVGAHDKDGGDYSPEPYFISGGSLIAAGTMCYLLGINKKKRVERFNQVYLFQQDFQFGNNTLLTADVNMINDNITHDKSLGLGLRFTF